MVQTIIYSTIMLISFLCNHFAGYTSNADFMCFIAVILFIYAQCYIYVASRKVRKITNFVFKTIKQF